MDIDPVAELSQSLKAAGLHPSQCEPVVLVDLEEAPSPVKANTLGPHFVNAMTPDEIKCFGHRLTD